MKLNPIYNKRLIETILKERYDSYNIPIGETIKRLANSREFQYLKEELRSQGWKDWHLLNAIGNIVLNYQLQVLNISTEELPNFAFSFFDRPEVEMGIITPLKSFTKQNMKYYLERSMIVTLRAYGFEKVKNLNIEEVKNILYKEFNYWEDDIPHESIFEK